MPANYTGTPTNTQAPSPKPAPEIAPIGALPADGDPVNAASWLQPFKALLDAVAWLFKPRSPSPAAPTTTDPAYKQWIWAVRNSLLQKGDFFDFAGYGNMARISRWQERWADVSLAPKTGAGSGAWGGRWNYYISAPGGATPVMEPRTGGGYLSSTPPPTRAGYLLMDSGPVSAILVVEHVEAPGEGVIVDSDTWIAWQTELGSFGGGAEYCGGILGATLVGNTGAFVAAAIPGAAVLVRSTDTTLQLYTCPLGGPAVVTNTTAPLNSQRVRLDIIGANRSPDGNARVVMIVDNAVVANVALTLDPGPPSTNLIPYFPFFRLRDNGIGRVIPVWGITDFAANRFGGDVGY